MNNNALRLELKLWARLARTQPKVRIYTDFGQEIECQLSGPGSTILSWNWKDLSPGAHWLKIDFVNKCYDECEYDNDMAVVIDCVTMQNFDHDFKIYSTYRPEYPEHWIKEEAEQGRECPEVIHSNYLGWNGTWCLDFETPIYKWCHQKMGLGWLI